VVREAEAVASPEITVLVVEDEDSFVEALTIGLTREGFRVRVARDTLIDRIWGSDYVGDTKTLDVHVKRLRAKIEPDPSNPTRIVTIRGLGYKYDAPRR
jgi:DNA-binding response OmpR family regulator